MSDTAPGIEHAQLDWDADGQPLSRTFGDVYFSRADGLAETRHVFLHHNQLAERFAKLTTHGIFTIGETGFGSGLNFLAAWQLWLQTAPADASLHFVTTEKFPLNKADLSRALALWPELAPLAQALVGQYPEFIGTGFHRLQFANGRVSLTLIINDAATGLEQLARSAHPQFASGGTGVDAWFLDGFAPAKNPQMWSPALFSAIRHLSRAGTTAATFSAAGIVKQGLREAGFSVRKVPGFGRKREMVSAVVDQPPEVVATPAAQRYPPYLTPWSVVRAPATPQQRTAIIIGGGLAGCHTAHALAQRGWQVTLVEREAALAQGASGNQQGVLYAKLSPQQESLAAFNLACLQFALRYYAPFFEHDPAIGDQCGVLQLAHSTAEQTLQQQLLPLFNSADTLVRFVDAQQASTIAGIPLPSGGLFFPSAGWINPPRLCRALTSHPNIRVLCHTEALSLARQDDLWHIKDARDLHLAAEVVVVANAADALHYASLHHLPLKTIRGQVSYLPATGASRQLQTVICSDGYLAPVVTTEAGEMMHCTGATFNHKVTDPDIRSSDHQTNLRKLAENIPHLAREWNAESTEITGRVGFRCTTPDYLPITGPAPNFEAFVSDYEALRKDARATISVAGDYWPGLYVNVGHGSRGLVYTPLCAQLLAAQITGEPLPMGRDLAQALSPARFIIRNLQRNKC